MNLIIHIMLYYIQVNIIFPGFNFNNKIWMYGKDLYHRDFNRGPWLKTKLITALIIKDLIEVGAIVKIEIL